jgi:hypothetical protein
MKSAEPEHPYSFIDAKLISILRSSSVTPPWYEAWSRLGPRSSHEDRLKVYQAIRDAGTLSEDISYFPVCWAVEHLTQEEDEKSTDPLQTVNLFEAVRTSERNFELLLELYGEVSMAELVRTDPAEHERRREVGRLYFFGPIEDEEPDDPDWLEHLLRVVANRVIASRPVASLAYRYCRSISFRELHVCPPLGAAGPGGTGWALNIEELRESFTEIEYCGWYAAPAEQGESPYFWIEGKFRDHEVLLRVLAEAERGKEYQTWRR